MELELMAVTSARLSKSIIHLFFCSVFLVRVLSHWILKFWAFLRCPEQLGLFPDVVVNLLSAKCSSFCHCCTLKGTIFPVFHAFMKLPSLLLLILFVSSSCNTASVVVHHNLFEPFLLEKLYLPSGSIICQLFKTSQQYCPTE